MPDVADAVVIGAGVMGASIALELQRAGRSVVVVDKGDAVGGGSTSSSSAVVRFNFSTLAGVVADRYRLKQILIVADIVRGVAVFGFLPVGSVR